MKNITLQDLVGDTDKFWTENWRKKPFVYNNPKFIDFITEKEMWDKVDRGLLVRPYYVAFNEGIRSALSDITKTRNIVGHAIPGYINSEQVKEDFKSGGTFKFNQPEHWNRAFAQLVNDLSSEIPGELETYVFLSPPDRKAIETHMDGSHVFVIQVSGKKDWTVGLLDEDSISGSDRYKGKPLTEETTFQKTLEPGDILYMPHGSPHHAIAREGNSIHIALTVEEPTPQDLIEVLSATLLISEQVQQLEQKFLNTSPIALIDELKKILPKEIEQVDSRETGQKTLTFRQSHWK